MQEVFADHLELLSFNGRFAHLTLSVIRHDEPSPSRPPRGKRVTAARLVLSPDVLLDLHAKLSALVDALEKHGTVRRETVN